MFSERCVKLLSFVCLVVVHLGSCCVLYDSKTRIAYVTKINKIRTILCMFGLTCGTLYAISKTAYVYSNPSDLNKTSFPICCIFTMIMCLSCVPVYITFFWIDDFKASIQQNMRYAERFKRKWVIRFDYKREITGLPLEIWSLMLLIWLVIIMPLVPLVFFFVFPKFPLLPHTILPSPWNSYWIFILPSIFSCYAIALVCCSIAMGHSVSLSVYFAFAVPVLTREFRGARPTWFYRTRPRLRHVDVLPTEYKALELLHKQGMVVYGKMIAPCHLLFGQFTLMSNYTLIKHWGASGILTNLMMLASSVSLLCFWSATLEVSGRFHNAASRTVKSWSLMKLKSRHDMKTLKRFRRSCRPLAIEFEQVFKIKRLTVLKFIRGVVKGTFRALLLSKRRH